MSTPKFNSSRYSPQRATTVAKSRKSKRVVADYDGRLKDVDKGLPFYADGSDAYANSEFTVDIEHVPSNRKVSFKAFINGFNENYNCEWASETVFGRPDAIHMYKTTQRSINMSLLIPASTEGEAFENLGRVQQLVQFLYPVYTEANHAQTISQSPLLRLHIMNLIADRSMVGDVRRVEMWQGGGDYNRSTALGTLPNMRSEGATKFYTGTLGVIQNLNINQNLDNPDAGVFEINRGIILPKLIEINFEFAVIHEHPLGWTPDQEFSESFFPYGVDAVNSYKYTKENRMKRGAGTAAIPGTQAYKDRVEATASPPSEASQDASKARLLKRMVNSFSSHRDAARAERSGRQAKREARRLSKDYAEVNETGHQAADDSHSSVHTNLLAQIDASGEYDT
tara:strand:+ start:32416 stop:33603 length:1188 start_codon:yes stop_codon:yes gene_type:complete